MVFNRVLELAVAHDPVRYGPNRHQPAPGRATHAAVWARAPAELGTPSSESPLENRGVKLVRLNGYPQSAQSAPSVRRLVNASLSNNPG